jgi:hypothetical protein
VRVEISLHPQTVATTSHHFAKPTASPHLDGGSARSKKEGWIYLLLAFCTLEIYTDHIAYRVLVTQWFIVAVAGRLTLVNK